MNYSILNDFVTKALEWATFISLKYNDLKKLESEGFKDDLIYKETCDVLKEYVKNEEAFYNSLSFNNEEIDYMISYTSINYNIDMNVGLNTLMHDVRKEFNVGSRVIFKLESFLKEDFSTEELQVDKDDLEKHIKFQKNLWINYCLVLESFLKRYILDYSDCKEQLLYIKYLIPYLNNEIEHYLVSNYDFSEELYLDYKIIGDYFKMSDWLQTQYINLQLFDKFVDEINDFLEINDNEFQNNQNKCIVSEIIIKSISVFFDDDFLTDAINDLSEHIEKNILCFFDNSKAGEYLFDLFKDLKKDKKNFSYLSLRLPRN